MQPLSIKFLFILLVVLTANPILKGQSCYELVWSDEFNYKGLPDSTKWSYETGGGGFGNNELQYYTKNNAHVNDSVLIIEARKESYMGSNYTSSRLITYPNFSWKYGKIEARMKLPFGQGIWPAFWMLGDTIFKGGKWPACGEIDIMELIGGGIGRDNVVHGTAHWEAGGNHASYGNSTTLASGIFADTFHIFSIEWNATTIKWMIDGKQYNIISTTPISLNEFRAKFFILFNIAVGGTWPGNPDVTTQFPQQMVVDYVRVYQLDQTPEITGKNKVSNSENQLTFEIVESEDFTYNWTVPDDAIIVNGQGTNKIEVNWGCNAGNVSCSLVTPCQSYNLELPVSVIPFPITGEVLIEENDSNLIYQVPNSAGTNFNWQLPDGVAAISQADSNAIEVNWGASDGTLKVFFNNFCGTDSSELNVRINRQLPYPNPDQPHVIPGTIESTDFDFGGEGKAYHDSDADNVGTGSRQDEGVDIEANDGGENVGWVNNGEWLEYTVSVDESKTYDVEIRVASIFTSGKFKLLFNGVDRSGVVSVPNTGAWNKFSSIYVRNLNLETTDTIMRVAVSTGNFNLGRMIFADSIPDLTPVSQINSNTIHIFPSTVSDFLKVKNLSQSIQYTIFDVKGQLMLHGTLAQNEQINVSDLKEGIYVISLNNYEYNIVDKFIKINSK